jgi:hypothetical protein
MELHIHYQGADDEFYKVIKRTCALSAEETPAEIHDEDADRKDHQDHQPDSESFAGSARHSSPP